MQPFSDLARLSLNQITAERSNLQEAIEGCVRAGIPSIGLWRHKVAEVGLRESARMVQEAGLTVSSLLRGGMFPAATAAERQKRLDDNRRAIDEARELGTDVLVLVCGAAPDRDLDAAREMVAESIAALVPYAQECGVKLGIEPLHPMYAGERSVIVSLRQAIDLAHRFPAEQVGVAIDVYHVWWDPDLYVQIERAAGRIVGFHVNDWLVPTTDLLNDRGMMGDGVIELRRIRTAVDKAGYTGPIEVEIFNQAIWELPLDTMLSQLHTRYLAHV